MKNFTLIAAFVLFAGLNGLFAQNFPIYPIPSYNCQLTTLKTGFQQKTHVLPGREKRDMDVVISSSSTNPFWVYAKVWVVQGTGSEVKGPYIIFLNQLLSVPIDNTGQWGVIIDCNWDVAASVWIN